MLKVTAPETIRTEVKVAASTRSWPRAMRHKREFAAKANMAKAVSKIVRAMAVPPSLDLTC